MFLLPVSTVGWLRGSERLIGKPGDIKPNYLYFLLAIHLNLSVRLMVSLVSGLLLLHCQALLGTCKVFWIKSRSSWSQCRAEAPVS